MKIQDVADQSGVAPKMIRHYQALGLLHDQRGGNNYRQFSADDVARLRLIRDLRDLNLPLPTVKRAVEVVLDGQDDRPFLSLLGLTLLQRGDALERLNAALRRAREPETV